MTRALAALALILAAAVGCGEDRIPPPEIGQSINWCESPCRVDSAVCLTWQADGTWYGFCQNGAWTLAADCGGAHLVCVIGGSTDPCIALCSVG